MGNPNKRPKQLSLGQVASDLKALKDSHDRLKATVGKLKDILQIQDNWHSHVSRWINKKVIVALDPPQSITGTLLWTDRYNIGLKIDGELEIFNKGHVVSIRVR